MLLVRFRFNRDPIKVIGCGLVGFEFMSLDPLREIERDRGIEIE